MAGMRFCRGERGCGGPGNIAVSAAGAVRRFAVLLLLVVVSLCGCGGDDSPIAAQPAGSVPPPADAEADSVPSKTSAVPSLASPREEADDPAEPDAAAGKPTASDSPDSAASDPPPGASESATMPPPASPDTATPDSPELPQPENGSRSSLDEQLAGLQIPPAWLESVTTRYDTNQPWKEARLEIRRLFSLNQPAAHREGIKLMWIYRQKDDIGDGHEYAMYTFLGGEPLWSVRAHEEYLSKPHENTPIHAYLTLASLYVQFHEPARAKACLDKAMAGLPGPPWDVQRKADVLAAYGDLYADWGDPDQAKQCYAQAAALYPTAKPPYGGHLLPRRAAEVQAKLDRLTFRSLQTAALRDGRYRDRALGYAGDIDVTVTIQGGRIAGIQLKHEEKIDQNACIIIPQRIQAAQSLEVDGISGATVTKEAIVNGVYRCLKQAGLE